MSAPARTTLSADQRRRAFLGAAVLIVVAVFVLGALNKGTSGLRHPAAARTAPASTSPRIVDAGPSASKAAPRAKEAPMGDALTTASATSTTASPAVITTAPPPAAGSRSVDQASVLAHARAFLAAYLVYEVEPLNPRMRTVLRRSATGALASRLAKHGVRLASGDRSAVGTVQSLELGGDLDSSSITVDATIEHAGWVSGLILDFQRAGGRWLVSGVS